MADLAPILDPEADAPGGSEGLAADQSDALARLDLIAPPVPALSARIAARASPEVAFGLAVGVTHPAARWRAIVARAFARADAVAWCFAESRDDFAAVEVGGRRLTAALRALGNDEEVARFDLAWRRLDFAEDRRHDEATANLYHVRAVLADRAGRARALTETLARGRPQELARTYFVRRLALAYGLLTGNDPAFDGGNPDQPAEPRGPRKHAGAGWHDLINAALDLTRTRGHTSGQTWAKTDAILRAARDSSPIFTEVEASFRERLDLRDSIRWADLPTTGIEGHVGCDDPPTNRTEAYGDPARTYRGRTWEG